MSDFYATDAYSSGFDVPPEISYEQALQENADAELMQAANDFEGVVNGLHQFVGDAIRPERIAVTQVTNNLQRTIDDAIETTKPKVLGIANELNSLTDTELVDLGKELDKIDYVRPPVNQDPPLEVDPLAGLDFNCLIAGVTNQYNPGTTPLDEYLGPLAFPGARWGFCTATNGNCPIGGTSVYVLDYSGGETTYTTYTFDPNCGPAPKPKPQPVPEPAPKPQPVPMPVEDWCTQLCNCLKQLDEQPQEPAWAKNLCDLIEGCKTNGEPRNWVDRLCECVTKLDCEKVEKNVWCNCETGEVLALDPDETPPGVESSGDVVPSTLYKSPISLSETAETVWQLIATFSGSEITTLPLRCFFPEPKPEPKPKPKPGGFGVNIPDCQLPPVLVLGPEALNRLFVPGEQSGPIDVGGFLSSLGTIFKGPTDFVRDILVASFNLLAKTAGIAGTTWQQAGCKSEQVPDFLGGRATLSFLERLLPGLFTEQIQRLTQAINEQCPSTVPTPTDAHQAFLADKINREQWGCWVRANGFNDKEIYPTLEANGTRPGVNDVCMLIRRGIIKPNEFPDRFRNLGILDPKYAEEFFQLTEQRPAMSDIIRFMVRDVDDQNIVNKFGLDTDFAAKYGQQLRKWSEDQGIPEDVARYAWRAHWSIPAPGQLFEIYHRVGRNPDGSPIQAVYDDVVEALKQQDILPFWIPRLLAISEKLPTRVDIRRGYRVGVFSRADVLEQYVRRGYSTLTAEALTRFATIERNQSVAKSPWVTKFSRGELNQQELRDTLQAEGADPQAIDFAVERGRLMLNAEQKKQCLKSIRHKIMLGELNKPQADAETFALTNDSDQTKALVNKWFCERDSKSKVATASQLCQFFSDGLIDSGDFYQRLVNLGYELNVASELVARCQLQLNRKLAKLEAARLAKIERENRQILKNQQRAEKASEAQRRATEKARLARASKREKRQKTLLETSKLLAAKTGLTIQDVFVRVKRTYNSYVRNGFASAEKIATDAKVIAGSNDVTDLEAWEAALLDVLAEGPPD